MRLGTNMNISNTPINIDVANVTNDDSDLTTGVSYFNIDMNPEEVL